VSSPEASLERTDEGLIPAGKGWFVLNAREAAWTEVEGRGAAPSLQGRADFSQLGLGIKVLGPGEPMAMYHWETDEEDFLVLAGEGLLIIEGEERPLRQWDFVHCPPGTNHVIVGAGDGPCVVFAVGALERHTTGSRVEGTLQGTADWGAYTVDEAAVRHGAGVEVETTDAKQAYARFPDAKPMHFRDSLFP
jgi:mannose-6-phosphate isomerase-like protein (cupin superfamily)